MAFEWLQNRFRMAYDISRMTFEWLQDSFRMAYIDYLLDISRMATSGWVAVTFGQVAITSWRVAITSVKKFLNKNFCLNISVE